MLQYNLKWCVYILIKSNEMISAKYKMTVILAFIFGVLNAQYSDKKLKKFVEKANENIQIIQKKRKQLFQNSDDYELQIKRVISPFLDYDFEVISPLSIDDEGNILMEIKYLAPEEPFIYSVKGNIKSLVRTVVDIYFILEFEHGTLLVQYEDLNTGVIETDESNLIHLGVDNTGLTSAAEKAGIQSNVY